MPSLRKTSVGKYPIAILCSDLHLRETTPRARAESNWYEVMDAHLTFLWKVRKNYDVPIICAGDVFDKWNPSAELVNFAIARLPNMFAVPGQHDLRYHSYDERHRGAYGALCKAGKIVDLPANSYYPHPIGGGYYLRLWAMPWGKYELPDPSHHKNSKDIHLGVLHQYRWSNANNKHAMAEDSSKLESLFPGLDALLIGDNHIPWELPRILNHGGFIPQNSDQKEYVPHYGILYDDGHIERHPYDVPAPQWVEEWSPSVASSATNAIAGELIQELENLETSGDTFVDRLRMAVASQEDATVRRKLEEIYEKVRP